VDSLYAAPSQIAVRADPPWRFTRVAKLDRNSSGWQTHFCFYAFDLPVVGTSKYSVRPPRHAERDWLSKRAQQ
jgi:hypothetical protein